MGEGLLLRGQYWPPDSTRIGFVGAMEGDRLMEIYVAHRDGFKQIKVTNNPGLYGGLVWKPVPISPATPVAPPSATTPIAGTDLTDTAISSEAINTVPGPPPSLVPRP